jgi:hypothetical protein
MTDSSRSSLPAPVGQQIRGRHFLTVNLDSMQGHEMQILIHGE